MRMRRLWAFWLLIALLLPITPGMYGMAEGAYAGIVLNELMASNKSTLRDARDHSPDWVELYNAGDAPVDLTGLCLSDNARQLDRFVFDGVTLQPGECLLVYCSGEDRMTETELHASFKLAAEGETLYLSHHGVLLDSVTFLHMEQDVSLARGADGAWALADMPTPGRANDAPSAAQSASLRINEVMTSAAPFKDTQGYDWVELHNAGESTIPLEGYTLALGLVGGRRYTFERGVMIAPGQTMALYCTTDALTSNPSTGFNLPAQNAVLSLLDPQGTLVDRVSLGRQYGNISFGRAQDGSLVYFETPTRGRANGVGYAARADAPTVSLPSGLYDSPVTVELFAGEGMAIHYTLDGSTPTRNSPRYEAPIALEETAALRAVAASDAHLASAPMAATYVIGLEEAVPVVSLMTDRDYLFSDSMGLLVEGSGETYNYLQDWEYPVQIEYFNAEGMPEINQICGFRISGESSRQNRQKAFSLFARGAYGEDLFHFNPFPNREYASYKSFILRASGSEGPSGTRFQDAFLSSLGLDEGILVSDAQPALVYLNGKFWGLYNLRERLNKYGVAQYENVIDEDAVDAIDLLSETGVMVRNGSNAEYYALSRFMKNNDLNDPANLEYVLSQMDVNTYFTYVSFAMMTANTDMSNMRFYRVPGGKWKWAMYDLDTALWDADSTSPMRLFLRDKDAEFVNCFDHIPFRALMDVPEMKARFLTRFGELLLAHFVPEELLRGIDAWAERYAPLIPYHAERWENTSVREWERSVETLKNTCAARPAYILSSAQSHFGLTDEEMARYFGAYREACGL